MSRWFNLNIKPKNRKNSIANFLHYLHITIVLLLTLCIVGSSGITIRTALAAPLINEYPAAPGSEPYSITQGSDGSLWFTEVSGNKIGRITTSGNIIEYPIPTPSSVPVSIAGGSDGNLWFTEELGNQIGRISTSGLVTEYQIPSLNSFPVSIVSGSDGALWFTEYNGNRIGRITVSGDITEYAMSDELLNPSSITAGPDGALWFVNGTKYVGRITTGGSVSTYNVNPSNENGVEPTSIITGPDGALWFTDYGNYAVNSKIGRLSTSGEITEYPTPTFYSQPQSITTGPDGALWFTELGADQIGRITTSGSITEYPIPTPNSGPVAIVAGPDGALWFSEAASNVSQIGRISIPDTTPPVITSLNWSTNPLQQGQNTILSVAASDDASGVSSVQYSINNGSPQQMTFDSTSNSWKATFGSNLSANTYNVIVTATDNAGNTSGGTNDVLAVYNTSNGYVTGHAKIYPTTSDTIPIGLDTSKNPTKLVLGFTNVTAPASGSFDLDYSIKNNENEFSLSSANISWVVVQDNSHASILGNAAMTTYVNGVKTTTNNVPVRFDVVIGNNGAQGEITIKIFNPGDNPNTATATYMINDPVISAGSNLMIHI